MLQLNAVTALLKAQICIPSHPTTCMATYVYETIPQSFAETFIQFEVVQSMKVVPLATYLEIGQPVRRVVMGGYGLISGRDKTSPRSSPVAACSPGCACHRGPRIPSP